MVDVYLAVRHDSRRMKSTIRAMLLLAISIAAGMALAGWLSPHGAPRDSIVGKEVPRASEHAAEQASSGRRPSPNGLIGWELFRALPQFLQTATAQELETLAAGWGYRVQANKYPEMVWKLVLTRWLELDPEGALRCERKIDSKTLKAYCYRTWIHLDYDAALAFALAEDDPPYDLLLEAVAKRDPELGLQWAEETFGVLYPFMEAWGREDANAAIQAIERFPAYHRPGLLSAIVRSYAKVVPHEAADLLAEIESPHSHYYAAVPTLTELAKVDPSAAQAALEKLPPGQTRAEALEAIAKERARKDPEAALAWAKGLTSDADKRQVIHLCIERLARDDHKKVLTLIDEVGWEYAVEDTRNRPADVVYQALLTLAKEDPQQALAHLSKAPKEEGSEGRVEPQYYTVTEIARRWFEENPVEALEWMQQAQSGEMGAYVPEYAIQGATEDQLATVAEYLIDHPEGPHTAIMSQRLLREMADKDPSKALNLVEQLDSAGAMQLLDGGDVGESAYWAISAAWSDRDSLAASAWLRDLPSGPRRDEAVDAFVYELINHPAPDFEAAFHWARTIESPDSRRLKGTWRAWHHRQPDEADEALEQSDLSQTIKDHLRTPWK